ncbi:flagellar motor switch protein FliM [Sphingosinicella sp.]|uniref:flagellar motor switch protein FliM n=1 Tax=Sphingosinicella sp. TaxID=1917971 RepID=UPI004037FA82
MADGQEAGPGGTNGSARPFPFGAEIGRPTPTLPAIDRLNERLARKLRSVIEPLARAKPKIAAAPTVIRNFGDWQAEQPEFTSLSLYSFKPMKGPILLKVESDFISRMVDAFYGGSGITATKRGKEFTATEESLLGRFAEALIGALAEAWAEIIPAKPALRARETNIGYVALAKPDEPVAVSQFTVQPWPGQTATIEFLYPLAGLRSVEAALAAKMPDEVGAKNAEWKARLDAALGEVRVEARTVLARPELQLSELMRLQTGDVIPVSLPHLVPLIVEGRRIAIGAVGEHDGRAALRIERIEQGRLAS